MIKDDYFEGDIGPSLEPIPSDAEPNFAGKLQGGSNSKDLGHLKLLSKGISDTDPKSKSDQKAPKQIDLRKGITIEKTLNMKNVTNGNPK